jgi:hypothetical protein
VRILLTWSGCAKGRPQECHLPCHARLGGTGRDNEGEGVSRDAEIGRRRPGGGTGSGPLTASSGHRLQVGDRDQPRTQGSSVDEAPSDRPLARTVGVGLVRGLPRCWSTCPTGCGADRNSTGGGGRQKGPKLTDPPHECGGSGTAGAIRSRTWQVGLGGWRLQGLHREAGGLPPDVDSSLHGFPASKRESRKPPEFYETGRQNLSARVIPGSATTEITRKRPSRRHSRECQDFLICHGMPHASPGARNRHHTGRL